MAHSHVGRHRGDVCFAVVIHGQNEIRNIARRNGVTVPHAFEVGTRGFKIRRLALAALVDVHRMFPGRQILDIKNDFHSFGSRGERGCTDVLALRIDDDGYHRLACGMGVAFLGKRARGDTQAECGRHTGRVRRREKSSSFFLSDVEL